MAGSIEANAINYKKQAYHYIAPASPNNLIESTSFVINFTERKFIHVGLDPANKFNTVIHIITHSRHICLNPDYLKRIFSLMGHILSVVLDAPNKTREAIFLADELITLSKMVYRGNNMLVLNSKVQSGCRVLLNRDDLLSLQYMEWSICESIVKKNTIIKPIVLEQFMQITNYLKDNLNIHHKERTKDEITTFVRDTQDKLIIDNIPRCGQCFVSQIKLFAVDQLVHSILTTPALKSVDEIDRVSIYAPPQSNYATLVVEPTPSETENKLAIDVNDGPAYYDYQYMTTPPLSPINYFNDYAVQSTQWDAKNKLFTDFM